ncbi:hypothetical protein C6P45_004711 [Maudiozyma exigua]|uniref:Reduced meiotic recombination protein 1 n=1 Tax=Maudiozyma exigua TaxID=34358 RepID=A0A9P6W9V2_MAUEX|nr:hypothetical protein C6P45_004711 [Kazachstania exigua]
MSSGGNDVVVDGVHVALQEQGSQNIEEIPLSDDLVEEESFDDEEMEDEDEEMIDTDTIRNTAKLLMRRKPSKFLVKYEDDTFLLFDYDDDKNDNTNEEDNGSYPIICEDIDYFHESFKKIFVIIRKFIQSYYTGVTLGAKEIVISIPALDLMIYEDNMYNDQASFSDLETNFQTLCKRSRESGETEIPKYLSALMTTRPRFVSRYNTLVELTEGTATLRNIKPFLNNEDNPVVLDDEDDEDNANKALTRDAIDIIEDD